MVFVLGVGVEYDMFVLVAGLLGITNLFQMLFEINSIFFWMTEVWG